MGFGGRGVTMGVRHRPNASCPSRDPGHAWSWRITTVEYRSGSCNRVIWLCEHMSLAPRTRLRVFAVTGIAALLLALTVASAGLAGQPGQLDEVTPRARDIHTRAIVTDTHIDTPQRLLFEKTFDMGARNQRGSIDIPRMRQGGLDAAFFSIWMPGAVTGPPAVSRALRLIDSV